MHAHFAPVFRLTAAKTQHWYKMGCIFIVIPFPIFNKSLQLAYLDFVCLWRHAFEGVSVHKCHDSDGASTIKTPLQNDNFHLLIWILVLVTHKSYPIPKHSPLVFLVFLPPWFKTEFSIILWGPILQQQANHLIITSLLSCASSTGGIFLFFKALTWSSIVVIILHFYKYLLLKF